ncbi:MAG TPA: CDP-alcohol phosphatidyltransferase family protein [Thermoanaerobaculia bacterium]|nr:CDP-alcohol phosphatidyltransferase family protein [Thermoanaerobaculia bacterium]
MSAAARRPLKTRDRLWARSLARLLADAGVRPNWVSGASVFFAAAGGALLALSAERSEATCSLFLLAGAACAQLRLLCNLLDGLLAVEGGLGSPAGEVWNDLPDRLADPLILVGAGVATRVLPGGLTLGWLAAILALLTAYVRVLGASVGVPQDFSGPMAKPHRMAAITVGCIGGAVESAFGRPPRILYLAIVAIVAGAAFTVVRRTTRIVRELRTR